MQTFSDRKAVIHYSNSETIHHISVKQGKLPKTVSIHRQKRQTERDPTLTQKSHPMKRIEHRERKENTMNERQKPIRFCPNCGSELTSVTSFCPHCGGRINNQPQTDQGTISKMNSGEESRNNTQDLLNKLNNKSSDSLKVKSTPLYVSGHSAIDKEAVLRAAKISCIIFLILGFIFLCIGFYKISAYDNSSSSYVNSYVGGDAYNYIINGTYFAAYAVMGTGSWIIAAIMAALCVYLALKSEQESSKNE